MQFRPFLRSFAVLLALSAVARAETHPSVPALSSLPGAAYTIYLDFAGFSFPGDWTNDPTYTPGVTPAYDVDGNAATFSATELANIRNVWSRAAEKYAPFNVNVTTVDPAVAAGQAATDAARTAYYDSQARMMHTVIGGDSSWLNPAAGGFSQVGVTANAFPSSNGYHTDWIFSNVVPTSSTNLRFIGDAAAHENGHGFGLSHQSIYAGNTLVDEYNTGTGGGPGTVAPIMGNSYHVFGNQFSERSTWLFGDAHVADGGPTLQNDPATILSNPGVSLVNDGIGHSRLAATPLPLTGSLVNFNLAKGIIVPASAADPSPFFESDYTADFWSFTFSGGSISLVAHAGRSTITPGVADAGATLDTTLRILDANGNVLATSDTASLNESISMNLGLGTYYAEVSSAGDPTFEGYYDMGSFFLTGSLIAVPEPATWVLLATGLLALAWRKRRRA